MAAVSPDDVKPGYLTSEFFALFLAHALILLAPLVGYPIDASVIPWVLGVDGTYILGRSGLKAVVGSKTASPPPTPQDVATEVLKQLNKEPAA